MDDVALVLRQRVLGTSPGLPPRKQYANVPTAAASRSSSSVGSAHGPSASPAVSPSMTGMATVAATSVPNISTPASMSA